MKDYDYDFNMTFKSLELNVRFDLFEGEFDGLTVMLGEYDITDLLADEFGEPYDEFEQALHSELVRIADLDNV